MSRTRLDNQRCDSAALTGFWSEADAGNTEHRNTGGVGQSLESSDLSVDLRLRVERNG